jgi:site-specific recombinase XerD
MPGRKAKPPRLYLRERPGRGRTWVVLDRGREISTGCSEAEVAGAARFLSALIAEKHTSTVGGRDPAQVEISDVLTFYGEQKAPRPPVSADAAKRYADLIAFADKLVDWWGTRKLSDVRGATCRDYVEWRTAQSRRQAKSEAARASTVSPATARRELEVLRAAVNLYHKEFTLHFVPAVTLPPKAVARERWLTRGEVARLLAACLGFVWNAAEGRFARTARGGLLRRDKVTRTRRRHIARFLLLGVYTGTRHVAIERLQWHANTTGGWVDLERGVLYRRGVGERETKKRRAPTRIPHRLAPHLRRWAKLDAATDRLRDRPTPFVIHMPDGRPLSTKIRTGWEGIVADAGLGPEVVPHVMRHTAATWQMQDGTDLWQAAGALAMTPQQLQDGYGHHHPDFQEQAASAAHAGRRRPR